MRTCPAPSWEAAEEALSAVDCALLTWKRTLMKEDREGHGPNRAPSPSSASERNTSQTWISCANCCPMWMTNPLSGCGQSEAGEERRLQPGTDTCAGAGGRVLEGPDCPGQEWPVLISPATSGQRPGISPW